MGNDNEDTVERTNQVQDNRQDGLTLGMGTNRVAKRLGDAEITKLKKQLERG